MKQPAPSPVFVMIVKLRWCEIICHGTNPYENIGTKHFRGRSSITSSCFGILVVQLPPPFPQKCAIYELACFSNYTKQGKALLSHAWGAFQYAPWRPKADISLRASIARFGFVPEGHKTKAKSCILKMSFPPNFAAKKNFGAKNVSVVDLLVQIGMLNRI